VSPRILSAPRFLLLAACLAALSGCAEPARNHAVEGPWHARLVSPGGDLPFGLDLLRDAHGVRAFVRNGPESLEVPTVVSEPGTLFLRFDHYDSEIRARVGAKGRRMHGTWRRRSGAETWTEMPFVATAGEASRFSRVPGAGTPDVAPLASRWSVSFSTDPEPAVALFETLAEGVVYATFMTATGDYRFLEGTFEGNRLRLSVFDGAHAFLFDARYAGEGPEAELSGDFWSRDTWHETWTARPDQAATLPDAFAQTRWLKDVRLEDLRFPDLRGQVVSLADPRFQGRARILEIFGSWCPNCNDALPYMQELQERYGPRGLAIVGIAFEATGDFERDARQVGVFAERYGLTFPLLVGGTLDKSEATASFRALDRIRSYPTTIFLDGEGNVRAVHSGFTGPATGKAYAALRREFETLIEDILNEGTS
jgi:thiol-disulfide isomerase/thioredoxin